MLLTAVHVSQQSLHGVEVIVLERTHHPVDFGRSAANATGNASDQNSSTFMPE